MKRGVSWLGFMLGAVIFLSAFFTIINNMNTYFASERRVEKARTLDIIARDLKDSLLAGGGSWNSTLGSGYDWESHTANATRVGLSAVYQNSTGSYTRPKSGVISASKVNALNDIYENNNTQFKALFGLTRKQVKVVVLNESEPYLMPFDSPATITRNANTTFSLLIQNVGDVSAVNTNISSTLPASFQSISCVGCTLDGQSVVWYLQTVRADSEAAYYYYANATTAGDYNVTVELEYMDGSDNRYTYLKNETVSVA